MDSLTMNNNVNLKLICFRIKNRTFQLLSNYIMIFTLLFITLISLVSVYYLCIIHMIRPIKINVKKLKYIKIFRHIEFHFKILNQLIILWFRVPYSMSVQMKKLITIKIQWF